LILLDNHPFPFGTPEEEADNVFAILKQEREEALDERARKHGDRIKCGGRNRFRPYKLLFIPQ
jgi:hypothetical protein